jgi:hypothetical protein
MPVIVPRKVSEANLDSLNFMHVRYNIDAESKCPDKYTSRGYWSRANAMSINLFGSSPYGRSRDSRSLNCDVLLLDHGFRMDTGFYRSLSGAPLMVHKEAQDKAGWGECRNLANIIYVNCYEALQASEGVWPRVKNTYIISMSCRRSHNEWTAFDILIASVRTMYNFSNLEWLIA